MTSPIEDRPGDADPKIATACPNTRDDLIEAIGKSGDRVLLRAQQRLARAVSSKKGPLFVFAGVLSIDAVSVKGQRQVLDFLMPGDFILLPELIFTSKLSIRAITSATLITSDAKALQHFDAMQTQIIAQLTRAHLQQLIIGQLGTEARVASFILTLAQRSGIAPNAGALLALPMSRVDIADFLAMNPDTLSRIMMHMQALGLIERVSRNMIRVKDLAQLSLFSPIASQINAAFDRTTSGRASPA